MAILVLGVGGTGKAVINILSLGVDIASKASDPPPAMTFQVVDQDPDGIWPGIGRIPAATGLTGTFAGWLKLRDWRAEAAAFGLFPADELAIDMERGFHQRPRVAATVTKEAPLFATGGDTVQVLIYSAIGGTGAGVGPTILRQMLARQQARHVVAIVFGRYLDFGPSASIAYKWLCDSATLTVARDNRWFTGRFVNVPTLKPRRGDPPASGLNEHSALVDVADFVWQLADADRKGRVDTFLDTAGRTTREVVAEVPASPWAETYLALSDARNRSMIAKCRRAAREDDIGAIIGQRGYLAYGVNEAIAQSSLAAEVWSVLAADNLAGLRPALTLNSDAEFAELFAAVPDPLSAAEWFHRAVASEPSGPIADLFRRLVSLHLSGAAHIWRTGWSFGDTGEIYALTLGPLDPSSADARTLAAQNTVGFFTPKLAPWTTAQFASNLLRGGIEGSTAFTPVLRVDETTALGQSIRAAGGTIPLNRSPEVSQSVRLESVEPLASWKWSIRLEVGSWDGLTSAAETFGLLRRAVHLNEGGVALGPLSAAYECKIRGVRLVETPLDGRDGIKIGNATGLDYFEVQILAPEQPPEVSRVLRDSAGGGDARLVEPGIMTISVGNVDLRLGGAAA
jgi:hypothetical protein